MKGYRYLDKVATLAIDDNACIGCGACTAVCPHQILVLHDRTVRALDSDACMECGACANNCPAQAITVTPGVGCAEYIMKVWLHDLTGGKLGSGGCC